MKIFPERPVFVFDTSALLELALPGSRGHGSLLAALDPDANYVYHPITLCEIADYLHPAVWAFRKPHVRVERVRDGIRLRRNLLTILFHHRKFDNPAVRLFGRRFLPIIPTFEFQSYLAHQRSQSVNVRTIKDSSFDRVVVLADMVDHQILGLAGWLRRSRFDARVVSGDRVMLGAAARIGIPWVYAHDAKITEPFPW